MTALTLEVTPDPAGQELKSAMCPNFSAADAYSAVYLWNGVQSR